MPPFKQGPEDTSVSDSQQPQYPKNPFDSKPRHSFVESEENREERKKNSILFYNTYFSHKYRFTENDFVHENLNVNLSPRLHSKDDNQEEFKTELAKLLEDATKVEENRKNILLKNEKLTEPEQLEHVKDFLEKCRAILISRDGNEFNEDENEVFKGGYTDFDIPAQDFLEVLSSFNVNVVYEVLEDYKFNLVPKSTDVDYLLDPLVQYVSTLNISGEYEQYPRYGLSEYERRNKGIDQSAEKYTPEEKLKLFDYYLLSEQLKRALKVTKDNAYSDFDDVLSPLAIISEIKQLKSLPQNYIGSVARNMNKEENSKMYQAGGQGY